MSGDAWRGEIERRMQAAGLPPVAIQTFVEQCGRLRDGATGLIREADIHPPEAPADLDRIPGGKPDAGLLSRVVAIKLNGGLGTSMGLQRAKSLLPVRDGLSFLDIIVRQTLRLRERFGVGLPLVFMNSFNTEDDTREHLRRYPSLAEGQGAVPTTFVQHRSPRLWADTLEPVEWPAHPARAWCPPGHGDLYPAMVSSGVLEALLRGGCRYAFVSNADNLGAVLDPAILSHFAASGAPFLMEVADRTEADRKGGHLARGADGRLLLRELAQCPAEEQEAFQDVGRHRYFNTNSIWLDLRALEEALGRHGGVLPLPIIRNVKPVEPSDPSSRKVIQIESAMGAAIGCFEGSQLLRVPRTRFAPVKTTSDLLMLWSDLFELDESGGLKPSPRRRGPPPVIELDARYYQNMEDFQRRFPRGAPSLIGCRSLRVRGDVRFAPESVLRGDVVVEHAGPGMLDYA